MNEEWRDVVGLEGRYLISSLGRVKGGPRLHHQAKGCNKTEFSRTGYERASLTGFDGKLRHYSVHTLVAEAFIGPRPDGHQVNHIDGDKRNNTPENLEYCTGVENIHHAFRAGLRKRTVGEDHYEATLMREWVIKIRRLSREGMSRIGICRLYGLSYDTVRHVLSGRSWAWVSETAA